MVGRTPSLGSLKKGILPRIHHPLPLSRRESQQLLTSITASFRKNLDKEHPWQSQDISEPVSKISRDTRSYRPTDQHLESILSSPLFSHPQFATRLASTTVPANANVVFESAVAKGMMTTQRAAGFLAIVKRDVSNSALDIQKGMASSGAGLLVVQWLRASGAETHLEFLSSKALTQNLVPFIFAEGLEEVAWTWLARLGARLSKLPQDEQTQRALAGLLQAIMKTQQAMALETSSSLDHTYSSFLRANQTIPLEIPAALSSLKQHWSNLSWTSTVDSLTHPTPSAPLYEMFVDVGRPWKNDMDIAHLELHHPTKPDHTSAVRYLHDDNTVAEATQYHSGKSYKKRMVSLGDDTVKRLEEVGQNEEASWVSEFMTKTFFAWNLREDASRANTVMH